MAKMFTLQADAFIDGQMAKVVPAGSQEAAFLLGRKGQQIPEEQAIRLGLVKAAEKAEDKAEDKDEDKAIKKGKGK